MAAHNALPTRSFSNSKTTSLIKSPPLSASSPTMLPQPRITPCAHAMAALASPPCIEVPQIPLPPVNLSQSNSIAPTMASLTISPPPANRFQELKKLSFPSNVEMNDGAFLHLDSLTPQDYAIIEAMHDTATRAIAPPSIVLLEDDARSDENHGDVVKQSSTPPVLRYPRSRVLSGRPAERSLVC